MKKIGGIFGILLFVCVVTAIAAPKFLSSYNLQNIIRWTALFGIPSIGVAFVIITGGIDLSIGSVIGLVGCLLPWLLVEQGWDVPSALILVIVLSAGIGLLHGLLITKMKLQPFVVTLCGLLLYRGYARYLTDDQTQGFGTGYRGLRELAIGKPCSMAALVCVLGGAACLWLVFRLATRRNDGNRDGSRTAVAFAAAAFVVGGVVWLREIDPADTLLVPTPFLLLVVLGLLAGGFLNYTIYGRYLFALGSNEQAARYSGINTDRMVILAYVLCSLLAGLAGILFALDVNSVQPAMHGNFYELYAIAAAVLGGCSLRGGKGSILGVILGAAVMRVLYNSINLLRIPTQLEPTIIGLVLLLGVIADELVKRLAARRKDTVSRE